ncbi:hypothetical protein ACGFNP_34530 [Nonomuraea sp. NPDC049269]|uniref:hypothetical protein n=1 Tax=Nonomuraea sp. NPDC049269 TaxID=3364349 RepID=UPI0037171B61
MPNGASAAVGLTTSYEVRGGVLLRQLHWYGLHLLAALAMGVVLVVSRYSRAKSSHD